MRTHQAERRATGASVVGAVAGAFVVAPVRALADVPAGEVAAVSAGELAGVPVALVGESACESECVEPCNLEPHQYRQPIG